MTFMPTGALGSHNGRALRRQYCRILNNSAGSPADGLHRVVRAPSPEKSKAPCFWERGALLRGAGDDLGVVAGDAMN